MLTGKLIKKIFIEGTIEAKTGLHIGGSNTGLSIGGVDATVVRNPISNEPYIPGSSLKGKMRSLLEKVEGKFSESGLMKYGPYVEEINDPICQIFGTMPEKMKDKASQPVTRLIVRDCELDKNGKDKLSKSKNTDMPYTEVKTEVVIDRVTSAATPRQLERVPAGATFNMRIILNVFDGDKEESFLGKIFESLCLVQNDYLGGKGTRGSGEVKIILMPLKQKTLTDYENNHDWQPFSNSKITDLKQFIPEELLLKEKDTVK